MVFIMEAVETKQEEEGSHAKPDFLNLLGVEYKEGASATDFYNNYRRTVMTSLKKKGDVIMWQNGKIMAEDEQLSPTFEELILAVVLTLIDAQLPGRVGKNPGFLKKTSPVSFLGFFWGFWGFFFFFFVFFFFLYICLEERVFRVFSVSRILLGASRL
jgi:hypothetical protein